MQTYTEATSYEKDTNFFSSHRVFEDNGSIARAKLDIFILEYLSVCISPFSWLNQEIVLSFQEIGSRIWMVHCGHESSTMG